MRNSLSISLNSALRVVAVVSVVFSASASSQDGAGASRYAKLHSITPFEKHCVSTSLPGRELLRCLDSQPDTDYYRYERKRSQQRLNTLDEIAYEIMYGEAKFPWETFCDNSTSEASLCLYYCYDGIPCPYK